MPVIHSAGKVIGSIQRCSRCGVILQDYRGRLGVGHWSPAWWAGNVFVETGHSVSTRDAANCKAAEHRVQWMVLLDRIGQWLGARAHH